MGQIGILGLMSSGDPYLSTQDIMDELKVSNETVRKWLVTGRLPYVKAGRAYRVRRSDFDRMLAGTRGEAVAAGRAPATSTAPNPMRPGAGIDSRFR
jgi:excisionase family DNA binding protein